MQLNGSQIFVEVLCEQGVDTIFGYPGGAVLNLYDELYKNADRITHVLTAHEQGASHAADGYARAIRPVHTANDGDSIYAVSLGDLAADQDVVGALAARVMAEAILRAVQAADSAYGFPAAKDLKR